MLSQFSSLQDVLICMVLQSNWSNHSEIYMPAVILVRKHASAHAHSKFSSSIRQYLLDKICIKFGLFEEHISTWIAEEHEFPLTVSSESDKCKRSSCTGIKSNTGIIDIVFFQYIGKHVPELILANLTSRLFIRIKSNWKPIYPSFTSSTFTGSIDPDRFIYWKL